MFRIISQIFPWKILHFLHFNKITSETHLTINVTHRERAHAFDNVTLKQRYIYAFVYIYIYLYKYIYIHICIDIHMLMRNIDYNATIWVPQKLLMFPRFESFTKSIWFYQELLCLILGASSLEEKKLLVFDTESF